MRLGLRSLVRFMSQAVLRTQQPSRLEGVCASLLELRPPSAETEAIRALASVEARLASSDAPEYADLEAAADATAAALERASAAGGKRGWRALRAAAEPAKSSPVAVCAAGAARARVACPRRASSGV